MSSNPPVPSTPPASPAPPRGELPPIRREVLVDAAPPLAFEVFTAGIGEWWPLADLSVHGAGATVAFTGGRLLERSPAGDESLWGTVTRWEPPHAVAFTWHPGSTPEKASNVTVSFTASGEQTLVTLEHDGWEAYGDPAAARAEYGHGWPGVLDRFREQVSSPPPAQDAATWVALLHHVGPAAPPGHGVFADPRFAEHLSFLGRMRERGYLVAAGPLPDQPGAGMAILRLPGSGREQEAAQLANDDLSVTGGLFTVTVQPWQVMLEA